MSETRHYGTTGRLTMFPKHPHYETARDKQAEQAREEVAEFLRRKAELARKLAGRRILVTA